MVYDAELAAAQDELVRNRETNRFKAEIRRLKSEIQTLTRALDAARWALLKVFCFVPENFRTGWTDEVQEAIDEARAATRGED